jgi:hypothetical protein
MSILRRSGCCSTTLPFEVGFPIYISHPEFSCAGYRALYHPPKQPRILIPYNLNGNEERQVADCCQQVKPFTVYGIKLDPTPPLEIISGDCKIVLLICSLSLQLATTSSPPCFLHCVYFIRHISLCLSFNISVFLYMLPCLTFLVTNTRDP